MFGELVPLGGGDTIQLMKHNLVGRRESCEIVLRFANVSAHHCQLSVQAGYWYVKDMGSKNGIKVNGVRCQERRLDPGDTISVAKHQYEIKYSPAELGAVGPPPADNELPNAIFKQSLLERAGWRDGQFARSIAIPSDSTFSTTKPAKFTIQTDRCKPR